MDLKVYCELSASFSTKCSGPAECAKSVLECCNAYVTTSTPPQHQSSRKWCHLCFYDLNFCWISFQHQHTTGTTPPHPYIQPPIHTYRKTKNGLTDNKQQQKKKNPQKNKSYIWFLRASCFHHITSVVLPAYLYVKEVDCLYKINKNSSWPSGWQDVRFRRVQKSERSSCRVRVLPIVLIKY